MKDYSGEAVIPNRVILPVVDMFPHQPIVGEILFFNQAPREGIYLFDGTGWRPIYSTENNIWEKFEGVCDQFVYELQNTYNNDGKSIVVYQDGVRLPKEAFAEVSPTAIAWKGENLIGGEKFEVQMFNKRQHGIFDVKAFNRRNGIC